MISCFACHFFVIMESSSFSRANLSNAQDQRGELSKIATASA
nr:MAG TPA: GUANINE NUCLEOTIDE-BINDING PROTEIN G(I) SUBUNIT-PEPTIDE COMPLEX, ADP-RIBOSYLATION, ARGININE FINGER [Caudoviricetes sp.]